MRFRTLTLISAMTLFAATTISAQQLQERLSGAPTHTFTRFNAAHPAKGFGQGVNARVNKAEGAITGSYQGGKKLDQGVAGGMFTIFDAPHAGKGVDQGTYPYNINAGGDVTGYYQDAKNRIRGFLRKANGIFVLFDVSGAGKAPGQGTFPQSINDQGRIAGYYLTSDYVGHGFARSPSGVFFTFDAPGAGETPGFDEFSQGTFAENINDSAIISGFFVDFRYVHHGFVLKPDWTFTQFDVPGAGGDFGQGTYVSFTGMNMKGTIGGYYIDDVGPHGYLRSADGNTFPTFDVYGAFWTLGVAINANDTITGYSLDQGAEYHGILRNRNGKITQFDDPNAGLYEFQGTGGFAINDSNTVAGQYFDENSELHGFVRSRRGVFTLIDVLGASSFPQAINAAGVVLGYFYDQNGAVDGFLYTPAAP
jgi:hypothetical protein